MNFGSGQLHNGYHEIFEILLKLHSKKYTTGAPIVMNRFIDSHWLLYRSLNLNTHRACLKLATRFYYVTTVILW